MVILSVDSFGALLLNKIPKIANPLNVAIVTSPKVSFDIVVREPNLSPPSQKIHRISTHDALCSSSFSGSVIFFSCQV